MTPFIVSHVRPEPFVAGGQGWEADADEYGLVDNEDPTVFRLAVATLEDAREECVQSCPEEMKPRVAVELGKQIAALTVAGGTIPLPDGGRVTVEPRTWLYLILNGGAHWADPETEGGRAAILAAWNERFGRGEHNTSTAGNTAADASGEADAMPTQPPWEVGQKLRFLTFDDDDADTRELDATTATVLKLNAAGDMVLVESRYGPRWHDAYAFEAVK